MKKIIALFLVVAMIVCVFVGCGKKGEESNKPSDSTATQSYEWPANLPSDADYDGYDFRILSWGSDSGPHWAAYEMYYDEDLKGDVVNDAVLTRDKTIEEKLNIKVSYNYQSKADIAEYVRTSINAGADDFDIVSVPIVSAASLSGEGLFLDLYDYKDILNLDEPWWDKNANDQLSIQNHLYFTTSALTLVDKNATWVVFFTKSMIDKYNLCPDYDNGIYSMVEEGEWTIDKMYEMVKAVSHDTGDGEMTDQDVYGHCGEQFNLGALMVGCGSHVTEKDDTDTPVYVWASQSADLTKSYDYVYDIVMSSDYSMLSGKMANYGYKDVWTDGFGSLMSSDRVLFNVTGMNRCKLYRDLDCEFGIVPVPKGDKDQKDYRSLMSMGMANSIAIPQTCKDVEMTCTILEAYTCLAYQTTYKAYIEKALTYKYLRDDDSAEMLDLIFGSRLYDPVDVYGWGKGTVSIFGAGPAKSAVTSSIRAVQKMTQKSMDQKIAEYQKTYEKIKR